MVESSAPKRIYKEEKKKENSYTYWVRKDINEKHNVQILPQKIEDPNLIRQLSQKSEDMSKAAQSAWNTAGTW